MARTTHHTALDGLGFDLVDRYSSEDRGRTALHYATARKSPGSAVPIIHHVLLNEYHGNPGKYNVSYHLTQAGQPYAEGNFDFARNHKDNVLRGGSTDPLGDVIAHHKKVIDALGREGKPNLRRPFEGEIPGMISGQIRPMQHLNAAGDWPFHDRPAPLDMTVHRALTGGAKGRPSFNYLGRLDPDAEGGGVTDLYHTSVEDPEDPYMRYGFSIRHMPSAAPEEDPLVGTEVTRGVKMNPIVTPRSRTFSYSVTHYPTDLLDDNGEPPVGEFQDVTGLGEPVANFTNVGALLERHKNVLRGLGMMELPPRPPQPTYTSAHSKLADDFDEIINGNGYAGTCESCGKPVYDMPESSFRDNKLYEVSPEDEYGPGKHGRPVSLCGECTQDYDAYKTSMKHAGWHDSGDKVGECPDCDREAMDQADRDLMP